MMKKLWSSCNSFFSIHLSAMLDDHVYCVDLKKISCIIFQYTNLSSFSSGRVFSLSLQAFQIPKYTDQEYQSHLHDDKWTRPATDHLFELSERFDARWIVIEDRFDHLSHGVGKKNVSKVYY